MENPFASSSWWRIIEGDEPESSTAIVAAVLAVLIAFYFVRIVVKGKPNLPPGPRGIPGLGSIPFLGSDLHVCFKELADTYGAVFSLRLGAKLCVVLSSPEAVKEALKDQDAVFANHDVPAVAFASSYGARDILWAPYGPFWRMVRKVSVRELLCPATIDGLYDLRRAQVRRMEEQLRGSAGKPANLRELVSAVAMNATTEMLWGGSVAQQGPEREAVEREFREVLEELINVLGVPNVSDFYPFLAWLDLQGLVRRTRKAASWVSRIFDRIIEERLRTMEWRGEGDAASVSLWRNQTMNYHIYLNTIFTFT